MAAFHVDIVKLLHFEQVPMETKFCKVSSCFPRSDIVSFPTDHQEPGGRCLNSHTISNCRNCLKGTLHDEPCTGFLLYLLSKGFFMRDVFISNHPPPLSGFIQDCKTQACQMLYCPITLTQAILFNNKFV